MSLKKAIIIEQGEQVVLSWEDDYEKLCKRYEEKIICPYRLGAKTREECRNCSHCNLGDCPAGAYFVWKPEERIVYEKHLERRTKNENKSRRTNQILDSSTIFGQLP